MSSPGVATVQNSRDGRLEETLDGLAGLKGDIRCWVARRRASDRRKQYATQLTAIDITLVDALDRLTAHARNAPASSADVHDWCRAFDRRGLLVRRVWRWYADRFDQRDQPEWTDVLTAADEVVWSVHAAADRAASVLVPGDRRPAPLPFIDLVDAPEAITRDAPPPHLKVDNADALLAVVLHTLPVPVVGLPAETRSFPWLLATLAHEVGHHLQHDLLAAARLVKIVGDAVEGAVARAGADEDAQARWRRWSEELFADLVGLLALGPAAIAVTMRYDFGGDAFLLSTRNRYPPPVVRLALQVHCARRLKLDVTPMLDGLALETVVAPRDGGDILARERARARGHLDLVPAVGDSLLAQDGDGLGPLSGLLDFCADDFAPGGPVDNRAASLRAVARGDEAVGAGTGLRVVRQTTAAAVLARTSTHGDPPADRLAAATLAAILGAREDGNRAADAAPAGTAVGSDIADLLMRDVV